MTIDLSNASLWLSILNTLAVIVVWLRKPGEDAGKALVEVRSRLDVIDEKLRHVPTENELGQVETDVAAIRAVVDSLVEAIKRTDGSTRRIEDYLLRGVKSAS